MLIAVDIRRRNGFMASIYLQDILKRNDLDPKKVKMIRHSLNDKDFGKCYQAGFMEEYQKIQSKNFFNKFDYLLTFISGPGTSAKFVGCYTVGNCRVANKSLMKVGFPCPDMFDDKDYYFDLEECSLLSDLKHRLIIDWGRAPVVWGQNASNDKEVLAIQENPKLTFCGYENVVLSYSELKKIVEDQTLYENWHTALSSVYAIYLIVDTTNGKQYVGSAYGDGGLLSRWKYYVDTKHGGNKGVKVVVCNYPDRYKYFQFSILQILPKTVTNDDVLKMESIYKEKLLTRKFGMNEN